MILNILLALIYLSEASSSLYKIIDNSTENWTSCEEFLEGTSFDPRSVIDVDWKIFYFWSMDPEDSYHIRFSIPTVGLLDRFRVELDGELKPPVNWTDADLFFETSVDLSGLFIKTDLPGKYRLIPSISFQYPSTPYLTFALKVVEPGYLGLMNCKQRLCYALANIEKMPKQTEINAAARKIGFRNPFGRSYLVKDNSSISLPPAVDMDDAVDDVELEIEREINNLQIL